MDLFLMTIVTGIMVGSIYALVALGWVLIYKCSGVLNLAMGEMTLIGAYVSLSFYSMGVPFLLSLLFSLIIGFVLGILTERIFLDKLIGEPVLTVIMVTVGLSFFFKGIVELIWGTDTQVFTPPVFSIDPIHFGPLVIGRVYLWSFVAAIVLLAIFVSFFKYTRWGLAMQATADDEMAALSLGVSARFVYARTLTVLTYRLVIWACWFCLQWFWGDLIPYPVLLSAELVLEYYKIYAGLTWTGTFQVL